MTGLWIGLGVLAAFLLLFFSVWIWLCWYVNKKLYPQIVRIFQEKPLFIIPRGKPVGEGEEVNFPTENGLSLRGLYLPTTAEQRQGVILFGLEFGSNRWACVPYCQFLREAGFDIFTFEPRSQGDSDPQPGYEPLQWVTDYEVADMKAALAYLKSRPDADPRGVGFFGISKGGSAGLLAAVSEPQVRCFATDGIFATHTTMLPYMRKWIAIYSKRRWLHPLLPDWFYLMFASKALWEIGRERHCRFPHLEAKMHRLAPRPLLMIHGGADTYIKPEMAQALFERAQGPKELWLVDGAKHNQAFQLAGEEYQRRVLAFFLSHLGTCPRPTPPQNGTLSMEDGLATCPTNGTLSEESRLAPLTANQG